jgi:hypothetical protein
MKLQPSIAVLCMIWSASSLAGAQPPPPPTYYPPPPYAVPAEAPPATIVAPRKVSTLDAPRNALELSVATGYTQGFGQLRANVGLPSVISAGVGLDLGVGWRISPRWAVLWTGEYQEFTAERSSHAGGLTNTLGVQYHFAPTQRTDPWAELGAGYRFLWETSAFAPTLYTHGFQLVHVRLGLDFRANEQIALGPIIGADATMFRYQDGPYFSAYIPDARVSTFIYAGIQGRFDIGGQGTSSYVVVGKN